MPLNIGYYRNQLHLFAIPRAVVERAGGLDRIDMQKVAQTNQSVVMMPFYDTVPNQSRIESEHYEYMLTAVTDTAVTLTLYRRIITYDNKKERVIMY